MLNEFFYPTPKALINEMLSGISNEDLVNKRILEPSAGKGNIVDQIQNRVSSEWSSSKQAMNNIDCIESDPELIATLQGKGYNVIHNDFLKFHGQTLYDFILMNPPFQNGDEHLLHAWEILKDGQIICILNAETIKNPYSGKRKLLLEIIEKNGSFVFLEDAFKSAERKTQVEVALVRLKKEYAFAEFDGLTDGLKQAENQELEDRPLEIAIRDQLENKLIAYRALQDGFAEMYRLVRKLAQYAEILGSMKSHDCVSGLPYSSERYVDRNYLLESLQKPVKEAWNYFFDNVRLSAWESIFDISKISSFATQKVRENFQRDTAKQAQFEFNRENVESFIFNILMSRGAILNQCVVDAFDLMTKYHAKNAVHVEGWKSNKAWKINRRVILPYIVSTFRSSSYTSYSMAHSNYRLDDIDRAMCFLSGEDFEELRNEDIYSKREGDKNLLDNGFRRLIQQNGFSGVTHSTKFFEIKAFYKGTGHFYFKDEKLWEKFNKTAARGKNWLPDTEEVAI